MSLLIEAVRDATPDWFLKEYPSIIPDVEATHCGVGAPARALYVYSPIFRIYSATGASTNRPSVFPAAAACRIAVAEAG
jgi:hypothetical protein